jgi:hypothetical protein
MTINWPKNVDVHSFKLGTNSATATATIKCKLVGWTRWSSS